MVSGGCSRRYRVSSSLSEIDQNEGHAHRDAQPLGNPSRPAASAGLINLSRPDDVPLIRLDVHYRYPSGHYIDVRASSSGNHFRLSSE